MVIRDCQRLETTSERMSDSIGRRRKISVKRSSMEATTCAEDDGDDPSSDFMFEQMMTMRKGYGLVLLGKPNSEAHYCLDWAENKDAFKRQSRQVR